MLTRGILAFMIVFFISAPVLATTPDLFLKEFILKTESTRNNVYLDNDLKTEEYKVLFIRYFDLPLIGRFVLGRYWHKLDPDQQTSFVSMFTHITVNKFALMISEASFERIVIGQYTTDARNSEFWLLESIYTTDSGRVVKIVWRGRTSKGKSKIVDIVAEGVSFAITYRSEYGSFIKSHGIENLLIEMQRKVSEM